MSPAKRKSAKSGRAASVAARAGKARGKPPGSALAKAVKVKGKTPAKGKDHRLAVRSGAKPGPRNGLRNGAGVACDLPREQLELLLDRDGGREDVLTHVPACHPCTTSLTVIASQRDAIRHLTAEPGGTAVEYLLERGARAGERKLADLVYELAKACVAVVQDIDRRLRMAARPRIQQAVAADVSTALRRWTTSDQAGPLARLTLAKPTDSDALVAAESCLDILRELEGDTERYQLTAAVNLILKGRLDQAASRMREFLAYGHSVDARRFAYWNLMWALIRQRQHIPAIQVGNEALREFPGDWSSTFNLVVAAANDGQGSLFRTFAAKLRAIDAPSPGDQRFRQELVRFEAPRLAEPLGLSGVVVARLMGALEPETVGSHESH